MAISFFNIEVNTKISNKLKIYSWIKETIIKYNRRPGDINIIISNDKYLVELNKRFLKKNYFTDIITFNYNEENIIAGDLYISINRVKENASSYKVPLSQELARIIIHGILHLLGFEDNSPENRKIIREAENEALLNLKTDRII